MVSTASFQRFKLIFFCPPQYLSSIKEAIFSTGAGSYPGAGNYTKCAFTTPGVGQFLPGDSAQPAIGEPGKVEEVGEVRCEIMCVGEMVTKEAVAALKKLVSESQTSSERCWYECLLIYVQEPPI